MGGRFTNLVDYTYDDLNRLVREEAIAGDGSGGYTVDYTYDIVGNRLERTVNTGGQILQTRYTYNDNDLLLSESNSVTIVAVPVRPDQRYAQVIYRPLPTPWSYYGFMMLPVLLLMAFLFPLVSRHDSLYHRSSILYPRFLWVRCTAPCWRF